MLITLIILIVILIHTIGIGHLFLKAFKASDQGNIIITSLIGSLFIMMLLNLLHFILPISWGVFFIISIPAFYGSILYYKKNGLPKINFNKTDYFLLGTLLLYLLIRGTIYPSWTDSNLYHAQVIQWYNTYPITKGIANLFCAYGLNSNFHLLASLYTFDWTGINLPNTAILYFEIIFTLFIFSRIQKQPILLLVLLWYFVAFWSWESSPSPDMIVTLLIIMIGIVYCDKEISLDKQLLIIIVCLFSFTIKQSAFVIVLLIPFALKKFSFQKNIVIQLSLFVSLFYSLWVIRNVVLSGYPLYPLTFLDIFDFKHKVPKELVEAWTVQVTHFARRPIDTWKIVIGQSFQEWLPYWFNLHRKTDRLLMVFTLFNVIYSIIKIKKQNHKPLLGIIIIALSFWLFKVSTMRFAYGYMFLLIIINFKDTNLSFLKDKFQYLFSTILIAGIIYTLKTDFKLSQIVEPASYQISEVNTFYINSQVIHVPIHENCKNTPIPCMYLKPEPSLKMFSDKLSDGFYQSMPSKIDIDKRGY